MPRPPRIQFAGTNHHIVTRGDARRKLFHDTGHYERFTRGLQDEVLRSGWIVLASCGMPNRIHALIQTAEPNLASGMQHWLSGYANWYAKRNRRTGHLYLKGWRRFLSGWQGAIETILDWGREGIQDHNRERYCQLLRCAAQRPTPERPESHQLRLVDPGSQAGSLRIRPRRRAA